MSIGVLDGGLGAKVAQEALDAIEETCTVVRANMDGFKLTQQYGVFHFLRLVFHCRKTFNRHVSAYHGKVVKCNSGNIIATFKTASDALNAIRVIRADIGAYNVGKGHDFRIESKMCLAEGTALVVGDIVIGPAWDAAAELVDARRTGEARMSTRKARNVLRVVT